MSDQPKALIDAEILLYSSASAAEHEDEWAPDEWLYLCRHEEARAYFQDKLAEIREALPGHRPVLAFGDRVSFRYSVWPAYKANRKKTRRPAGYRELIEWVMQAGPGRGWDTVRLPDVEADDVLGLMYEPGDVICSTDKDMLSVPGLHYRGGEIGKVTNYAADLQFFTQTLVGDSTDNYPGCKGVGKVGAEKLLGWCVQPWEMWEVVREAFLKAGHTEAFAIAQARCARILRPGEYDLANSCPILWTPPVS